MPNELDNVIEGLQRNDDVDAVFITGSGSSGLLTTHSDIDLTIVFKENHKSIRSLYTFIDNKFADVFFFDSSDIDRIGSILPENGNSMDGMFVNWLQNSDIKFDRSGKTTALKGKMAGIPELVVSEEYKFSDWQKANYNLVRNRRYFDAHDQVHDEALELFMLYSVIQLITAYFSLRNIPWRGEKRAMQYLKERDVKYSEAIGDYFQSKDLKERMAAYEALVSMTFTDKYPLWGKDQIVAISKTEEDSLKRQEELTEYWRGLIK
jgi:hypothetical protein